MKRITLFLLSVLISSSALGAVRWSPSTLNAGQCSTFSFGSADSGDAQPPINVPAGELSFTSIATSGTAMSVSFYMVTADSSAPASATGSRLLFTGTTTSAIPTPVSVNGGYVLDPDIDTAGSGGSVTVCSAGYVNSGRKVPTPSDERFAACQGGALGGDYDPTSGTFGWICLGPPTANWHAQQDGTQGNSIYTKVCTAASTPDAACESAGEVLVIGFLHSSVGISRVKYGGEAYIPLMPGTDNTLYVDRGCGLLSDGATRADCPRPYEPEVRTALGATTYAQRGAATLWRVNSAIRGVRIRTQVKGTYTKNTAGKLVRKGVWLLSDTGLHDGAANETKDGPAANLDPVLAIATTGGVKQGTNTPFCDDTSATNPDCNETQTGTDGGVFAGPAPFPFGINATLQDVNGGASANICVPNGMGTGETDTSGTCPGDRMTRCWATGATTLRSSGGCCWDLNSSGTCNAGDYDISGGVGCQGLADAVDYEINTRGRRYGYLVKLMNCNDGAAADIDCQVAFGDRSYVASVNALSGACGASGKTVFLGTPTAGITPMLPPARINATGTKQVQVVDLDTFYNYAGTFDGLSIMPADWRGRSTCSAGTEAACDGQVKISLNDGGGGAYTNAIFAFSTYTGSNATAFDGATGAIRPLISGVEFTEHKHGVLMDISSNWDIVSNRFTTNSTLATASPLIASYSDGWRFQKNEVIGGYAVGWLNLGLSGMQRDISISDNIFRGLLGGGNAIIAIGSVSNVEIVRNRFIGIKSGYVIRLSPVFASGFTGSPTLSQANDIRIFDNYGEQIGADGTGVDNAQAAIGIFHNEDANTSDLSFIRGLQISRNNFRSYGSNACLVWAEQDDDAAMLIDESRPSWTINDNLWNPTSGQTFCVGDSDAAVGTSATSVAIPALRYQPFLDDNWVIGVPAYNHPQNDTTVASFGSAANYIDGYSVGVYDGTAACGGNPMTAGTVHIHCVAVPATPVWQAER
jgi:hypothetical protein